MTGDGTVRVITDLFFRRGASRRTVAEDDVPASSPTLADSDPVFPTKALRKFLSVLSARSGPVLLDVGPVVGSNINFFAEHTGCKIHVEDLFADLEWHSAEQRMAEFPAFLKTRLTIPESSVDAILCWDLFDYLDRPSAQVLGRQLSRLLRPGGALLGLFSTVENPVLSYTKFVVVDDFNLRHRPYPGTRPRQPVMMNREIIKLFDGLLVSDSFLLKINTREILFRQQTYQAARSSG